MIIYLEIKFNNRIQVDGKISWGLGGGFISLHSSFRHTLSFYPGYEIKDILDSPPATIHFLKRGQLLDKDFFAGGEEQSDR